MKTKGNIPSQLPTSFSLSILLAFTQRIQNDKIGIAQNQHKPEQIIAPSTLLNISIPFAYRRSIHTK